VVYIAFVMLVMQIMVLVLVSIVMSSPLVAALAMAVMVA
jgi:hypothetical protein